jgi:hypothetical protein
MFVLILALSPKTYVPRTSNTGIFAVRITPSATLPISK